MKHAIPLLVLLLAVAACEPGPAGAKTTVAATGLARATGFPQVLGTGEGLLFAWTEAGDPPRVRTACAPLR